MTYVNLCFSCSDDWLVAGLVGEAYHTFGPNDPREYVCYGCGKWPAAKQHTYIGKYQLIAPERKSRKKKKK